MGTSKEEIEAIMTDELLQSLRGAAWPGNIRELRNQLEQYLVFKDFIPASMPETLAAQPGGISIDASIPFSEARQQVVLEFERQYLIRLLELHQGNVSKAAAATRLDRGHLYRLLRRHKIKTG
jgi:DNA-binding NtrC family response regulator